MQVGEPHLPRLPQHRVRLRLHALERVDEHHGAVRHAHRVGHLAAEVNVTCVCGQYSACFTSRQSYTCFREEEEEYRNTNTAQQPL